MKLFYENSLPNSLFVDSNLGIFTSLLNDLTPSLNNINLVHDVVNTLLEQYGSLFYGKTVISIDGNIGIGKSYFLKKLMLENESLSLISEPVEYWSKIKCDTSHKNCLELYYQSLDTKDSFYLFKFQLIVMVSKLLNIIYQFGKSSDSVFLTERSFLSDKWVFIKIAGNLYLPEHLIEYDKIHGKIVNELYMKTRLFVVHLNADNDEQEVQLCMQRIKLRDRVGEEKINEDYIRKIQAGYLELVAMAKNLPYVQKAINDKHECSSRNDPHMTNFNSNNFEFHEIGQFCMYQSKHIQVKSEFGLCWANSAVTCNCMIRLETISGEFVEINTCAGNGIVHTSDIGVPLSCSQSISLATSIFDPVFWNSFGSNHNKFKCATTFSNSLVIKTTMPNSADDILVKVNHISQTQIGQIRIYPSDNYIASSSQYSDKCLCGIKRDLLDLEECKKALLDDCLQILIRSLSDEDQANVDRLMDECVLDKRALEKNRKRNFEIKVGHFQKNLIEENIIDLLIKNYGNSKMLYSILNKYCECKKMQL
ncbi:deoxycytidine kinase, partial [Brachionus plicatilis]